jgi:sugar lactone lactonase YvrE
MRIAAGIAAAGLVLTACAGPATSSEGSGPPQGESAGPTRLLGGPYNAGFFAFGPDGKLYTADCMLGVVLRMTAVDQGHVVAGWSPASTHAIPTGTDFGDGGPAVDAPLTCPAGLAFDPQGRLVVADHGHNRVRRVGADGTIETVVGAKSPTQVNQGVYAGDGGPALDASLASPVGLTYDTTGTLYISDRDNDRVRVVSPDGVISTLAGNGNQDFDGDGRPATAHSLDYPLSTVVDPAGDVYIADDNQNRIRKVTPDGTIVTVIGDGSFGSKGDGGPARRAQVNDPQGVALDAAGNLYVSEYGANRIRRIDPHGIVTTFAGTGSQEDAGMGGPAAKAAIPQPGELAIGPDGALYVQDQTFSRILRIDLETGIVTVVAGGPKGIRPV